MMNLFLYALQMGLGDDNFIIDASLSCTLILLCTIFVWQHTRKVKKRDFKVQVDTRRKMKKIIIATVGGTPEMRQERAGWVGECVLSMMSKFTDTIVHAVPTDQESYPIPQNDILSNGPRIETKKIRFPPKTTLLEVGNNYLPQKGDDLTKLGLRVFNEMMQQSSNSKNVIFCYVQGPGFNVPQPANPHLSEIYPNAELIMYPADKCPKLPIRLMMALLERIESDFNVFPLQEAAMASFFMTSGDHSWFNATGLSGKTATVQLTAIVNILEVFANDDFVIERGRKPINKAIHDSISIIKSFLAKNLPPFEENVRVLRVSEPSSSHHDWHKVFQTFQVLLNEFKSSFDSESDVRAFNAALTNAIHNTLVKCDANPKEYDGYVTAAMLYQAAKGTNKTLSFNEYHDLLKSLIEGEDVDWLGTGFNQINNLVVKTDPGLDGWCDDVIALWLLYKAMMIAANQE